MSLFSEIGTIVEEVLSDPDFATADVRIRHRTGATPGANPEDDPTELFQIVRVSAVVFTRETRKSDFDSGSLVIQRIDEITFSPHGVLVEENGAPVAPEPYYVGELDSNDSFVVDGVVRQITQTVRTPAAGADVSVWQVQVLR